MILAQPTKYGLRAILYVARRDPELSQSKEIAEALGIPHHYLAKILQDLSKRGILTSTKGRGGGFRLARPADRITLLKVVETLEGDSFVGGCVLGLAECSDENACPLHQQWSEIKNEILKMFVSESVMELADEFPGQARDIVRDRPFIDRA